MRVLEEYTVSNKYLEIEYKYFYRLLQTKYGNNLAYGIEIQRDDYKGNLRVNTIKDQIELVSPIKEQVKQIVLKLLKNNVSPLHLINIVGDFVDNHLYEFDLEMVNEA